MEGKFPKGGLKEVVLKLYGSEGQGQDALAQMKGNKLPVDSENTLVIKKKTHNVSAQHPITNRHFWLRQNRDLSKGNSLYESKF